MPYSIPALSPPALRPLLELGHAIATNEALPTILERGLRAAAALVPCDDIFLYLVPPDGASRSLERRGCLHEGPPVSNHPLEAEAAAVATEAHRQGSGARDGLLHPTLLVGGEKPFGVLVAARLPGSPPFAGYEEALLRTVGDSLSTALQAAALYTQQQTRMRELALLSEIANDCALGLDRFLPKVTERIYRVLKLDLSLLMLLDPQHQELVWGWGHQLGKSLNPTIRRFPADGGFGSRTIRTRQASRATPADINDPRLRGLAETAGLNHFGAVPLLVQDRAVGVLIVGRRYAPIEDDELRLLMAMGVQLAVAADNTRLLAETQQHAADITLVQTIGAAMAHSLDPGAILRQAVERLNAAMACDGVRLYRRRGTVFEMSTRRGPIPGAATTARQLPETTDVIRRAFAAGRAIDIVTSSMESPLREEIEAIHVIRTAVVPLWITLEDRDASSPTGSFGLLVVVRQSNRPFSVSELAVLDAVGGQLAIAFRNAELHEETKRRAEDLAIVNEAGRALLGDAPLGEALEKVGTAIARLARVPQCAFLLVDHAVAELRGTIRLADGTLRSISSPLTADSLVAQAVRERSPCPVPGSTPVPQPHAVDGIDAPRWAMALPLQTQDKVLGVALLVDPDAGHVLSEAEVSRVMAVGNQVAIAIDRASLNAQLHRSVVKLEQTQRQLVQRERLAALGSLSAQVAHEVRNPLGVITNSLGLLGKLTPLAGDALRVYGIMKDEVRRLDDIVGHMLDYTRPMEAQLMPTDLGRVLRAAVASAQAAERTRGTPVDTVETSVAVPEALPLVPLDERLFHQALVNLVTNAYHALNGRGSLRLEGALDPVDQRLRVSVQDTGPGLSDELKWRIFEPFFTTKAKGSGLGLAVVKRIVESHRGEISLESSVGQGTRFTIRLPVLQEGAPGAVAAAPRSL